MRVDVQWNGKMAFTAVSARSQNQVTMDSSAQHGGEGSGVSPMEMVLAALAGCSGMDVVSILNKERGLPTAVSASVWKVSGLMSIPAFSPRLMLFTLLLVRT